MIFAVVNGFKKIKLKDRNGYVDNFSRMRNKCMIILLQMSINDKFISFLFLGKHDIRSFI